MCNFSDGLKECPCCHNISSVVESRRLNTSYVDDQLNFLESCDWCFEVACEYYDELWRDYYRSR